MAVWHPRAGMQDGQGAGPGRVGERPRSNVLALAVGETRLGWIRGQVTATFRRPRTETYGHRRDRRFRTAWPLAARLVRRERGNILVYPGEGREDVKAGPGAGPRTMPYFRRGKGTGQGLVSGIARGQGQTSADQAQEGPQRPRELLRRAGASNRSAVLARGTLAAASSARSIQGGGPPLTSTPGLDFFCACIPPATRWGQLVRPRPHT